jgi:hypothetical protein
MSDAQVADGFPARPGRDVRLDVVAARPKGLTPQDPRALSVKPRPSGGHLFKGGPKEFSD